MGISKITEGIINADLYIWVSFTQQVEEGYYIEIQEILLRQYCEIMDWKGEEVYGDKIISGN